MTVAAVTKAAAIGTAAHVFICIGEPSSTTVTTAASSVCSSMYSVRVVSVHLLL
jgi:hypothetical protein